MNVSNLFSIVRFEVKVRSKVKHESKVVDLPGYRTVDSSGLKLL